MSARAAGCALTFVGGFGWGYHSTAVSNYSLGGYRSAPFQAMGKQLRLSQAIICIFSIVLDETVRYLSASFTVMLSQLRPAPGHNGHPLAARPASWWLLDLLALAQMAAERGPRLVAEEVRAMHDAPLCHRQMLVDQTLAALFAHLWPATKAVGLPVSIMDRFRFVLDSLILVLYQDTLTIFVSLFFPYCRS